MSPSPESFPTAFAALLALLVVPAHASSLRTQKALDRLEPVTRMMEVCDIKAGEEMRREPGHKGVDRVMVDAVETPEIEKNVVAGSGGAFRQSGRWYQLQFKCTLSDDLRSAVSFDFSAGEEIPEAQWEDLGLWK